MKNLRKNILYWFVLSQLIFAQDSISDLQSYWIQSGKTILTNRTNQWILGGATLGALAASQVDMEIKDYVQANPLLSESISHLGDMYGGAWAHWILWSSIAGTSILRSDSRNELVSKLEFSALAMLTNGVVTVGLKEAFGRTRPNGDCCESFPSGHTSHSFTIAAISHELYGNKVGTFAYGLATLVAVSRMNDNKHYFSDVLFGAALGTAIGRGFSLTYREGLLNRVSLQVSPQKSLVFSMPL